MSTSVTAKMTILIRHRVISLRERALKEVDVKMATQEHPASIVSPVKPLSVLLFLLLHPVTHVTHVDQAPIEIFCQLFNFHCKLLKYLYVNNVFSDR